MRIFKFPEIEIKLSHAASSALFVHSLYIFNEFLQYFSISLIFSKQANKIIKWKGETVFYSPFNCNKF